MTPPDQPTRASALPDSGATKRLRVLVVEEDHDARGALRMLLELRGYAVSEAAEGHGGVAHALAHGPDVAVIDIGLPGLDGYGVARGIREGLTGAPMFLIALTGYHEIEERGGASDTGFDAHLVKSEHLFELLVRRADRSSCLTEPGPTRADSRSPHDRLSPTRQSGKLAHPPGPEFQALHRELEPARLAPRLLHRLTEFSTQESGG